LDLFVYVKVIISTRFQLFNQSYRVSVASC
jgi:hypothetical protein